MGVKVSVVIPTLGRERKLKRCLEALSGQSLGKSLYEVIVADGGSKDGTGRAVKEASRSGMRVHFLVEKKPGAAAARNRGIERSGAPLIAFTDDDCVPDRDWLASLVSGMESDRGCSGAGGDVIPLSDNVVSRYLHHCGAGRAVVFGDRAIHLPTTNAIYRRDALLSAGMFDERVIICEDIHLSQKMLKRGLRLKKLAGARVRHDDPSDMQTLYRKSWLHGSGLATIARIEGIWKKRGFADLAKSLFSRSYIDRFSGKKSIPLPDRAAFALLSCIQKAGIHFGYISSR